MPEPQPYARVSPSPEADLKGGIARPARSAELKPVPDAQAIRALRIPEAAPPYDDIAAGEGGALARRDPQATVGALAVPRRVEPPQPAAAGSWPRLFAQILAETLAGYRPQRQLQPWTTERARRRISQLGPMLAGARQPRIRRVVASSPDGDVLEMAIIVDIGSRIRVVAVRLERPGAGGAPDRWQCTDVDAA